MVERVKIYHISGQAAEMDAFDAREALQQHADEWAQEPWAESKKEPVDGSNGGGSGVPTGDAPVGPFEAREKGRGWWAIYDSKGTQIGGGIREADGVEFNKFSEEEKQEYVNAELAKS